MAWDGTDGDLAGLYNAMGARARDTRFALTDWLCLFPCRFLRPTLAPASLFLRACGMRPRARRPCGRLGASSRRPHAAVRAAPPLSPPCQASPTSRRGSPRWPSTTTRRPSPSSPGAPPLFLSAPFFSHFHSFRRCRTAPGRGRTPRRRLRPGERTSASPYPEFRASAPWQLRHCPEEHGGRPGGREAARPRTRGPRVRDFLSADSPC